MIKVIRFLLFPFSLLYGLAVVIRNALFDAGWLSARKFDIPVISIGNLVAGGTGKSPMTEYLVRMLKDRVSLAVLSRGYGRTTDGFRLVEVSTPAEIGGDEPVQMKQKFPSVTIAVAEKRVEGIERLQANHQLILLDDAFQHRWVQPGFSILLFDYSTVYAPQFLLPSGNLREPMSGKKRAQVLVVTKTPELLASEEQERLRKRLNPAPHQHLFFSWLRYGDLTALYGGKTMLWSDLSSATEVLLITGIANPAPLLEKIRKVCPNVIHYRYPDHHTFSTKNIVKLASAGAGKLIITTEKDAQRLRSPALLPLVRHLPIWYLPVQAELHGNSEQTFTRLITDYVFTEHSSNR